MTTRFVRLAAGIAAVSLLAAACGDDSNDANTDADRRTGRGPPPR